MTISLGFLREENQTRDLGLPDHSLAFPIYTCKDERGSRKASRDLCRVTRLGGDDGLDVRFKASDSGSPDG